MKYTVSIPIEGALITTVEAYSEVDAIEKATSEINDTGDDGFDLDWYCQLGGAQAWVEV